MRDGLFATSFRWCCACNLALKILPTLLTGPAAILVRDGLNIKASMFITLAITALVKLAVIIAKKPLVTLQLDAPQLNMLPN